MRDPAQIDRKHWRSEASAVAMLFAVSANTLMASVAHAQDAESIPEDETRVEDVVIVTATLREADLQSVPLAVSAFSGDALADTQVKSFADLAQLVPGPTFVPISGASGSQLQIRGQYASDDSPSFDTPVGVFIDDVYYGSVASFFPEFYDIDQIAVLRGPQGTTFGRNTVGGALQVVSAKPNFDGYAGKVSATIRDPSGFESTGSFNIPLSETLAGRFAYSVRNVEGDIYNVTTGNDVNDSNIWSARGSLLWRPSDDLDVLSSLTYTRDNSLGDGPTLIGQGSLIDFLDSSYDSGETFLDDDGKTDREIFSAVVRADKSLDWGKITSITGYRTLDAFYREDIDGSPVMIAPNKIDTNDEEQFSQEIRLTSDSGGTFEWVAGLYYLHQNVRRSETYTFGADPSTFIFGSPWRINAFTGGAIARVAISGDTETESIAPFGELTWNLNDQWAITGGVRYTYDSKTNLTNQQNLTTPGASTIFFGLPKTVSAEDSWDAWTPRVILEYQPTDDLFLYASASRGFKSGGYNYAAPTVEQAATAILPETTMSYEVGAKTSWFDDRLRINAAAFDSITEDLQVRSLVGTTLRVNNAGEAEVKGVEIETVARPVENLALGLNYAYLDASYNSYVGCAAGVDCTGNKIPFVPENSFNISAEYLWNLSNGGSLKFRAEDSWADAYEVHIGNQLPIGPQFPRSLTEKDHSINAFLTYEAPGGDWTVQSWVRNVTDERYVTFATNYFFYLLTNADATGSPPLTEANRASVSRGRSFGVTATYRFD